MPLFTGWKSQVIMATMLIGAGVKLIDTTSVHPGGHPLWNWTASVMGFAATGVAITSVYARGAALCKQIRIRRDLSKGCDLAYRGIPYSRPVHNDIAIEHGRSPTTQSDTSFPSERGLIVDQEHLLEVDRSASTTTVILSYRGVPYQKHFCPGTA